MSSKKAPKKYNTAKLGKKRNDAVITYVLGGLAVAAIIVLIVVFVVLPNTKETEVQAEGYGSVRSGTPVELLGSGSGVLLGDPDGDGVTTIDAYEDFLCPSCGQFERQYGNAVNQAIDDGTLAVRYHMLNFLNRSSPSGDYSTRAAAAALCVADTGDGELFSQFHSSLFQKDVQPKENGSSDLGNSQLADVARQVGADDAVTACISDGEKVDEAKQRASASQKKLADTVGKVATPSIVHDGKKIDLQDTGWIDELTAQ